MGMAKIVHNIMPFSAKQNGYLPPALRHTPSPRYAGVVDDDDTRALAAIRRALIGEALQRREEALLLAQRLADPTTTPEEVRACVIALARLQAASDTDLAHVVDLDLWGRIH